MSQNLIMNLGAHSGWLTALLTSARLWVTTKPTSWYIPFLD